MLKEKLLVLVGPTAVGKTKLSLHIAEQMNAEIISGDSMQVYRGMDIGTAKATLNERAKVVHHLINIHEPDYPFSVAEFQQSAKALIQDINRRGKLPFMVGGTGLYVESVCYRYQFNEVGSDEAFREQMRQFAEKEGAQALHERLRLVDPSMAEKLHPNDQRRVVRALEVFHLTGQQLSQQLENQTKQSPYELCIIGLTMDRSLLYNRIEQRIDQMMEEGLVEEVKRLLQKGYGMQHISMQGLGYKEMVAYLEGRVSLEEAVYQLKQNTRRFAKRQLSWFRHMKEIQWVDVTDLENSTAHLNRIHDIIKGKFT